MQQVRTLRPDVEYVSFGLIRVYWRGLVWSLIRDRKMNWGVYLLSHNKSQPLANSDDPKLLIEWVGSW